MSGLRLSWEDERKKHNSRKHSVPYLKKFYKIFEQRFFFVYIKCQLDFKMGKTVIQLWVFMTEIRPTGN